MLIGFIFPVFIFFRVVLNILLLKYILFFILFVYTFRRRTLSTCPGWLHWKLTIFPCSDNGRLPVQEFGWREFKREFYILSGFWKPAEVE